MARTEAIKQMKLVLEGFPGESQRFALAGGLVLIDDETHGGFKRTRWRCSNCGTSDLVV